MLRRRAFSLISHYSKFTFVYHPQLSLPPLNIDGYFRYPNSLQLPHTVSLPSRTDYIRSVSLLSLKDLRDSPGCRKKAKRLGRGIGSGKGNTCGRGNKGLKARSKVRRGFVGGQTPLHLAVPKRKIRPRLFKFERVSLRRLATFINAGKINSDELITMKTLWEAGAISRTVKDGVRLYGNGANMIQWPLHLEVTRVSRTAKLRIVEMGGSVRRVYYNKLGMRALLKPWSFEKKKKPIPRAARPNQKLWSMADSVGRLPAPTKPLPGIPGEDKPSIPPASPRPDIPYALHGFITHDYRLKNPISPERQRAQERDIRKRLFNKRLRLKYMPRPRKSGKNRLRDVRKQSN